MKIGLNDNARIAIIAIMNTISILIIFTQFVVQLCITFTDWSLADCLILSLLLNAFLLVMLGFAFDLYKRARTDYEACHEVLNRKK